MECVAVGVYVQHVHRDVVGRQVEGLEDLLESHHPVAVLANRHVTVCLQGLLDEPQQVLLVHAGGGVDVGVHLGRQEKVGGSWFEFQRL